ncbi:flagellar basal body-associated FliL family protein [Thioclava sp. FR2]|uniref:flagellar basal body-associated FliL family protein n=1 Tax=Thioclava sp. FR2 TaxID=3445780 RepID=UPI003EB6C561
MTDVTAQTAPPPKIGKKSTLLGLLGAVILGAGGFAVTYLGLIPLPGVGSKEDSHSVAPLPDVGFVALDPLTVSLGTSSTARHLRFAAQLETAQPYADEVRQMAPRILDVLNSYLRAVEVAQLEDPAMLSRLKAQMLRRIQIVTGEGRVTDLLISEFVLN